MAQDPNFDVDNGGTGDGDIDIVDVSLVSGYLTCRGLINNSALNSAARSISPKEGMVSSFARRAALAWRLA
ncbi:hypothetical protein [Candidatus Amarolinea dominans]|uniref:hypothetical protein n=1 Tax=Candidatus Amarolinea dominans TaxID=3140696 RepID=UPI003135DC29|nr:hypothetical protein [Anaerolineae bacterium]